MLLLSRNRRGTNFLVGMLALSLFASKVHAADVDMDALERESVESDQSAEISPDSRWIPGFGLYGGFLSYGREGGSDSIERGRLDGDTTAFFGLGGLSGVLTTPAASSVPGLPRLFVHADVSLSLDNDEAVVNDGDPGNPAANPANDLIDGAVQAVLGVGSSLRVQSEPVILGGGVGVLFASRWGDRMIRIKPSIEWTFQREEIRLTFAHVETEGLLSQCAPCRTTSTRVQTTKGYHSVGPGLEIEADGARMGDFLVTVFMHVHALRVLGDRKVDLQAIGSWETLGEPSSGRADSIVTAYYARDPWSVRVGGGVRLLWSPE